MRHLFNNYIGYLPTYVTILLASCLVPIAVVANWFDSLLLKRRFYLGFCKTVRQQ